MAGVKIPPFQHGSPIVDLRSGHATKEFSDFVFKLWERSGGNIDSVALSGLLAETNFVGQLDQPSQTTSEQFTPDQFYNSDVPKPNPDQINLSIVTEQVIKHLFNMILEESQSKPELRLDALLIAEIADLRQEVATLRDQLQQQANTRIY